MNNQLVSQKQFPCLLICLCVELLLHYGQGKCHDYYLTIFLIPIGLPPDVVIGFFFILKVKGPVHGALYTVLHGQLLPSPIFN